ncbi:MAG: hypothetical protein CME86_22230 [Herbaspirillum sp.]|nr:hypothetical protein [Herbaspirillum sp.]
MQELLSATSKVREWLTKELALGYVDKYTQGTLRCCIGALDPMQNPRLRGSERGGIREAVQWDLSFRSPPPLSTHTISVTVRHRGRRETPRIQDFDDD